MKNKPLSLLCEQCGMLFNEDTPGELSCFCRTIYTTATIKPQLDLSNEKLTKLVLGQLKIIQAGNLAIKQALKGKS